MLFGTQKTLMQHFYNNNNRCSLDKKTTNEIETKGTDIGNYMSEKNLKSITLTDKKNYLFPVLIFFKDIDRIFFSVDFPAQKTYKLQFNEKFQIVDINSNLNNLNLNKRRIAEEIKKYIKLLHNALESDKLPQFQEIIECSHFC